MNRVLSDALSEHGVAETEELRLVFSYDAPDSGSADDLAAFLREEIGYDAVADADSVSGSTPDAVRPDRLDKWVRWMVFAGHEHGRCKFHGWVAKAA